MHEVEDAPLAEVFGWMAKFNIDAADQQAKDAAKTSEADTGEFDAGWE